MRGALLSMVELVELALVGAVGYSAWCWCARWEGEGKGPNVAAREGSEGGRVGACTAGDAAIRIGLVVGAGLQRVRRVRPSVAARQHAQAVARSLEKAEWGNGRRGPRGVHTSLPGKRVSS